jgi:hypothetical protein
MTTYTPEEYRAQAARMLDIPRTLTAQEAVQERVTAIYFNLGAGAAMLDVAAAQLENLQTSLELTETAYNAALDLQTTLLERCTHFQDKCVSLKDENDFLTKALAVNSGDAVTIELLREQIAQLKKENDFLRALTANSDLNCVYCGLGADVQGQCVRGFPGCARADDQMLCRNFGDAAALHDLTALADIERNLLLKANAQLVENNALMDAAREKIAQLEARLKA